MDFALTCMLCLAGAVPAEGPAPMVALDGSSTVSLAYAPVPPPDLHLSHPGTRPALAQHDHGSKDEHGEDGSQGRGGHGAWMGTTMIVVMVAMMATVGLVMMTRGGARSAPLPSPAARALPASGPAAHAVPGG